MEAQSHTIPALEKALEMLELLATAKDGIRQTELCEKLGLSTSTAYRMLRTLLARNWVFRKKNGVFALGNGMLPIFTRFQSSVQRISAARQAVHSLSDRIDMACKLSIRRGNEQVTIERAEPLGPYSLVSAVNSSFPVIEGSVGAALLVDESQEAILHLVEACRLDLLEKRQPDTIFQGIASVREKGYVLNTNPNRWNVAAMSAPLRDAEGAVVCALTIIGTKKDFAGKNKQRLAKELLNTIKEIGSNDGVLAVGR